MQRPDGFFACVKPNHLSPNPSGLCNDFSTLYLYKELIGFLALGGICSERFNLAILSNSESLILQSEKFGVPWNGKLRSMGAITTVPLENKFLKSRFFVWLNKIICAQTRQVSAMIFQRFIYTNRSFPFVSN